MKLEPAPTLSNAFVSYRTLIYSGKAADAMKDKCYGDGRDLVKWGTLLHLSSLNGATRIVQVAYYRPEAIERQGTIEIDNNQYQMPEAVNRHFSRSIMDVTRLNSSSIRIEVFDSPLLSRDTYMRGVQAALANLMTSDSCCIIFLDPDTGLQPKNKHGLEHVLESELAQIWDAMRGGDVLVFYQHKTNRKTGTSWIEPKRRQFASALKLSDGVAKMARGEVATDVVFFFAQKTGLGLAPEH
jgi:hypothetical protein